MASSFARIAIPAGGLVLFYWYLFENPPPRPAPVEKTISRREQTRLLAEQSTGAFNAKQWVEALPLAMQMHDLQPRNHIYLERLAVIEQQLHHPAEEARWWDEFMSASPTPDEACPRVGQAWDEAMQPVKSIEGFERCAKLNPNDPDSFVLLALAYERNDRLSESRREYEHALKLAPTYGDAITGQARLDLRDAKWNVAAAAIEPVLLKSPNDPDALLVAGIAHLRLRKKGLAQAELQKAVLLREKDADIHLALGMLADAENRREDALREYDRALELHPNYPDAMKRRARVEPEPP